MKPDLYENEESFERYLSKFRIDPPKSLWNGILESSRIQKRIRYIWSAALAASFIAIVSIFAIAQYRNPPEDAGVTKSVDGIKSDRRKDMRSVRWGDIRCMVNQGKSLEEALERRGPGLSLQVRVKNNFRQKF